MMLQPESALSRSALDRAVLATGALLLVAGLVSFFAFNWSLLTPLHKFLLLGGTVTLGAILSLWWRDHARQASLFLSFGATGVWLATIGQVYQTGADAWQLFAAWSALGLLWAWAAASPLIWVLVLLLVQFAVIRHGAIHAGVLDGLVRSLGGSAFALPLLTAWASFAVWEAGWRLRPALGLRGRWGLRVLGTVVLGLSLWLGLEGSLMHFDAGRWGTALVCLALLAAHALRVRRDLPLLGFALIAGCLLAVSALGRLIGWGDGVFTSMFLGLIFVALSSAVVTRLRKLAAGQEGGQAGGQEAGKAPPWYLGAIMGTGAWIGALLMLSFLASVAMALASWLGGAGMAWLIIGGALIGLARFLFHRVESMARQQFALAFSLAGQAALVYALFRLLGGSELHQARLFAVALVLLYGALSVLIPHPGHRFFAVKGFWSALTLLMITLTWPAQFDGLRDLRFYVPLLLVTAAGLGTLALRPTGDGVLLDTLRSPATRMGTLAALALGVLVLGLLVPKAAGDSLMMAGGGADKIAQAFSAHRQWSLLTSLMLAGFVAWRAWPVLPPRLRPSLAAALALATLLLWRSPLLFMGLAFVAACWPRDRAGQGMGVLLSLLGFSAFYYDLLWPLWFKALLLAAAGAALLLGRWYWARRATAGQRTRPAWPASGSALAALALVVTVAAALWGIRSKERILEQGQHVFLALAPVDPRSLMQGDYMALRFELAGEIAEREERGEAGAQTEGPAPGKASAPRATPGRDGQVWIRLDERRIAHLAPQDRQGPAADQMLLRFQRVPGFSRDPVRISTNAWFFQEGQGERFAKARYGEFVVDASGQALLVGLRDESLAVLGR